MIRVTAALPPNHGKAKPFAQLVLPSDQRRLRRKVLEIKGEPYLDTLGIDYLIQVPIGIALCAIAIWTTNRRYHLGLVLPISLAWVGASYHTQQPTQHAAADPRASRRRRHEVPVLRTEGAISEPAQGTALPIGAPSSL